MGKEKVKLSLLTEDMILFVEKPKDSTKKSLELINEFKVHTQKSVAFLYTNNEQYRKEIKKTIAFIIASKRILRN